MNHVKVTKLEALGRTREPSVLRVQVGDEFTGKGSANVSSALTRLTGRAVERVYRTAQQYRVYLSSCWDSPRLDNVLVRSVGYPGCVVVTVEEV